jgi:hypothetical protein
LEHILLYYFLFVFLLSLGFMIDTQFTS